MLLDSAANNTADVALLLEKVGEVENAADEARQDKMVAICSFMTEIFLWCRVTCVVRYVECACVVLL